MRDVMEYILEDLQSTKPLTWFPFPCPLNQEAAKRNLRVTWVSVTGHMCGAKVWHPRGSWISSCIWDIKKTEVKRERIFFLIAEPGWNFFKVGSTKLLLSQPVNISYICFLPGVQDVLHGGNGQLAGARMDAWIQEARGPHLVVKDTGDRWRWPASFARQHSDSTNGFLCRKLT